MVYNIFSGIFRKKPEVEEVSGIDETMSVAYLYSTTKENVLREVEGLLAQVEDASAKVDGLLEIIDEHSEEGSFLKSSGSLAYDYGEQYFSESEFTDDISDSADRVRMSDTMMVSVLKRVGDYDSGLLDAVKDRLDERIVNYQLGAFSLGDDYSGGDE